MNWLVAASFKLTGLRNEWTARLPSALCVLAVALAFITVARSSLGANGSLIAALIWLANFGMIEKGRLIEIEALYVSLFGSGHDLLAQLVAATAISVADLDRARRFSSDLACSRKGRCICSSSMRSSSPFSIAQGSCGSSVSLAHLAGHSYYDWDFRGLGRALLAGDGRSRSGANLVRPIHRPPHRRRLQARTAGF